MSNNTIQPFQVDFKMKSPIAISHPWINFDGILAWLMLREKNSDYRNISNYAPKNNFEVDIPLKKLTIDGKTFYSCSISQMEGNLYSEKIYKRFKDNFFKFEKVEKTKRIITAQGHFRSHMITQPVFATPKVTFYGCGYIEKIKELLNNLNYLGKEANIGYGQIYSFKIKETEEDCSIIKDGKLMKPIPATPKTSGIITANNITCKMYKTAYTYPHWQKENVTLCFVPKGVEING